MRIAKYCLAACLVPLWISGCQKGSSLKTVPVSGTVTLNGQALEGAAVSFLPKGGVDAGHTATGVTKADGRYELQTFESAAKSVKGAEPGEYNVIVTKYEAAGGMTQEQAKAMMGSDGTNVSAEQRRAMSGSMSPEQRQAASKTRSKEGIQSATLAQGPKMTLPQKYASPADSGLSATVAAGQNAPIDFQLTGE